MDFLLAEDFNLPKAGEIRRGYIIENRNNELLVDVGSKSEGIVSSREIEKLDDAVKEKLVVGAEIPVFIVEPEDAHGNTILSYIKAAAEQDWLDAVDLMKSKKVHTGKVIGENRGGILVGVGHIRGFVPNSQLSGHRNNPAQPYAVGKEVSAKVIEVDKERNRLILSEKAAAQEIRQAKRKEILKNLHEGDIRKGKVVNLADFGAFVDIGGVEGLVHLSELTWKRINNPSEVLKVGDVVSVYILKIDQERQRLALSIKRLEADPWTLISDQYQVGQLVEAKITKLTTFGAFARIQDENELEGLIHISEISENHIKHPSEVVKASQEIAVRIIRIEPKKRQLGLSIKQVTSEKFMETDLEMLNAA
jgi:small subunit ribosomal protein S1